jgi:8-oxo-dGTP pyrophosphatase MutT (NUDIX family)
MSRDLPGADLPSRFRVGAYGLLVEDGRVLITRTRTRTSILQNFPGGALELGEGALEALRREFLEETGLRVRPGQLAHATESFFRSRDYPENQLVKLYWLVTREGGEFRPEGNGDDVVGCFFAPLATLEEDVGLTASDREAVSAMRLRGLLPPR